ncbi:uncharacterized protein L3040_005470 [Drepanopeziza brunnea f. sp. 'multigermtubi']|uniref:uncharacterized protein n=1 Tax=Drepanopeziza brunnea f. sp. 'multigermtubi' TaxID=698441 RepID=UPI0023A76CDA|nr:hypothetical protein L3040_005470 [Drepanopeziza brunnea f. sp. 'multigermtubi']
MAAPQPAQVDIDSEGQEVAAFYTEVLQNAGVPQGDVANIVNDIKTQYQAMKWSEDKRRDLIPLYDGKGSKMLSGSMLFDPKQEITGSDTLIGLIAHLKASSALLADDDSLLKPRIDKILDYWTSACSLKQLDRFLNRGQPQFLGAPSPNGMNLDTLAVNPSGVPHFSYEHQLRRSTVRLLHYPGLLFFDEEGNFDNLRADRFGLLYTVARVLLEYELGTNRPDLADKFSVDPRDANNSQATWLGKARARIQDTLEAVAVIACQPLDNRPLGQRLQERLSRRAARHAAGLPRLTSREEALAEATIFRGNIAVDAVGSLQRLIANVQAQGAAFLDSLIAEIDARLQADENDHIDPLLLDLISREDAFERALTVEHYEDKLINKQVSVLDESRITEEEWLRSWSIERDFIDQLKPGGTLAEQERYVYKVLGDMSLVNRHRRNFRLLRDWAVNMRPWKQIYQLYSENDAPWVKEGIKQFDRKTETAFANIPLDVSATAYQHVVPKLFGIKPVNIDDPSSSLSIDLVGTGPMRKLCLICNKQMGPGLSVTSTVVELTCSPVSHFFHLQCMFEYWDMPGKLLHSCPTCGHMAKLNYETVGIEPTGAGDAEFSHNCMDYPMSSTVAPFLNHPDPVIRARVRKLYDVPGPLDPDPNFPDLVHPYWRRENALKLQWDNMAIRWESRVFPPGVLARAPAPQGNNALLAVASNNPFLQDRQQAATGGVITTAQAREQEMVRRVAADLGRRYLSLRVAAQNIEAARAMAAGQDPPPDDLEDLNTTRVLPGARYGPQVEAAYMRSARRRRNARQRRLVAESRRGLSGLR